jgi:hypothetical protein
MKKLIIGLFVIGTVAIAQTPLECLQSDIERQIGYEKFKQEVPNLLQDVIDTRVPPSEFDVIKVKVKENSVKSMVNISHIYEEHGEAIPLHIKRALELFKKQDKAILLLVEKF